MSSVQKPKYTMEDYVYVNGKMVPKSKLTYTDGGQATNTGVYPTSVDVGSFTPPPVSPTPTVDNSRYTYVPGSAAPTNANAMDYATWLQGNTKYQAGQMREQAVKQAETDRQRAIVDANSAYAKNQALYGANAENMASMGLSSSGYGEYLTGKAYATQRADVQNANATAQARKDQALYEEGRLKMQADQKYAEDLINIDNARNESYNSLYNSALNGASIESLMQDGRWSNLTVTQQNTIKQATTANSIKTMIDGGATLESLASNEGWLSLTNDQRNQLTVYANNLADAKATEAEGNFSTWLNGISSGAYTLDDVKAMSGYENLSPDQKSRLQSSQYSYNDQVYKNFLNAIREGSMTLEQVQADPLYGKLSEVLKGSLKYEAFKAGNKKTANTGSIEAYSRLIDIASGGDSFAVISETSDYNKLTEAQKASVKSTFIDSFVSYGSFQGKDDFIKKIKEKGISDQNEINNAVEIWQKLEYESFLNGSELLSWKEVNTAVEKGIITKEQMDSYLEKKYGVNSKNSTATPSGTLSNVGAVRNVESLTLTVNNKPYALAVNALPKNVTEEELNAFFGREPRPKSRGEADFVVFNGKVYIYGKAGWKVLFNRSDKYYNEMVSALVGS